MSRSSNLPAVGRASCCEGSGDSHSCPCSDCATAAAAAVLLLQYDKVQQRVGFAEADCNHIKAAQAQPAAPATAPAPVVVSSFVPAWWQDVRRHMIGCGAGLPAALAPTDVVRTSGAAPSGPPLRHVGLVQQQKSVLHQGMPRDSHACTCMYVVISALARVLRAFNMRHVPKLSMPAMPRAGVVPHMLGRDRGSMACTSNTNHRSCICQSLMLHLLNFKQM
jgi:hypothetical protein